MEHIRTQLPYAVVNGIIAFVAYIIAGVTKSPAALLFAVAALVAVMIVFNRLPDKIGKGRKNKLSDMPRKPQTPYFHA